MSDYIADHLELSGSRPSSLDFKQSVVNPKKHMYKHSGLWSSFQPRPLFLSSTHLDLVNSALDMGEYIFDKKSLELSERTKELVRLERQYVAGGFEPVPAFFVRGKGSKLWVSEVCNRCRRAQH